MATNLNLNISFGLPLCPSGITHPVVLSKEMQDHDRRRKVFKKLKIVRVGEALDVDQEIRRIQRSHERVVGGEDGAGDLAGVLHDLSCISLATCTAKAA